MTLRFDFSLTDNDINLTRTFMMLLAEDNKEYFTSDDFRTYSLDEAFSDPAHEIGTYFSKLKANGVVVTVGEEPSAIESNNKRRVDLLRWDWTRWRCIIRSRLTEV